MNTLYFGWIKTPIGILTIQANETSVNSISFTDSTPPFENVNDIIIECKKQLSEYFNHTRKEFTIPIEIKGTIFQDLVWNTCSSIEYGTTSTYSKIADTIHNTKAAIAVGQALKRNPILIILPCHRVLNISYKNTGYAGEIWRKDWLLEFEKNK